MTGMKLVFDLNAMALRNSNNSWDTTNARVLFDYMRAHDQIVESFQLGNGEPTTSP